MLASVTTDEGLDSIKLFMGHMLELMEAFDFLCAVMTRTTIQSEETIAEFGSAAKWLGVKYWEYFSKDATPKVHYLETHLIEELIWHKRLGLFDESPIERAHHTNHVYSRLFSSIKNWFNRQEAIEIRLHMGDVPDVHEAYRSLEDKSKRDLAASTVEASANKAAKDKETKKQRRDERITEIKHWESTFNH